MKKGLYLLVFLLSIFSVSALTMTIDEPRVIYPQTQSLDVNLGLGFFSSWRDVKVDLKITGPAHFSNGLKSAEYSYETLDKNIVITELISLETDPTLVVENIEIDTVLNYRASLFIGGLNREMTSRSKVNFLAVWTDKAACEEKLEQCGQSEDILEDTIIGLNEELERSDNENFELMKKLEIAQDAIEELEKKPTRVIDANGILIGVIIVLVSLVILLIKGKKRKGKKRSAEKFDFKPKNKLKTHKLKKNKEGEKKVINHQDEAQDKNIVEEEKSIFDGLDKY